MKKGDKVRVKHPREDLRGEVGVLERIDGGYYYVRFSKWKLAEYYHEEIEAVLPPNDVLKNML